MLETGSSLVEETMQRLKEEKRVIPGINDAIFKRIMMNHKEYLARILKEFIPLDYEVILEELIYIHNEFPADNYTVKSSRTDLLVKVRNFYIQIEANKVLDDDLILRNDTHFDALCLRIDGEKEKKNFNERLLQLNVNGKIKTKDIPNLDKKGIVRLQYMDKQDEILDPRYTKIHLNIEKCVNKWYTKSELEWLDKAQALLLVEDIHELNELVKGDDILEKVGQSIMDYSSISDIINDHLYELIEENYKHNSLKRAEMEATERGMEKGMQQGMQQGIEEGSRLEKIEIAKSMLEDNMSIELVSKYSGLSISELEKLTN